MENLLNVHPGLLIWTVITFLFVVLVLWKFVWGPILKGLDQRADKIEGDIQRAEDARNEAEKSLEEYKEQLAKARDEANAIIQESRSRADEVKNKIIESAESMAEEIKTKANQEMELSKKKVLQEIHEYATDLVLQVSKQLIKQTLQEGDHKAIIQKALDEYNQKMGDISSH